MITLNSCIQLFWGGGAKKGRGTFILNFLDFEELIRSHSFHGKPDKKEGKYAAIERKLLESSKSCSKLEKIANEERIRGEAKSILLTEDNLAPIHKPAEKSPDLIQGLPDISKLPLSTSRDSVHDSAQLTTNAKENSQQIKDDKYEIDFSFDSDIVSQSSASLNNQADSR